MKLEDDQQFLTTRCGGRQGCRLGALIFNLIYAAALSEARDQLAIAGCVLTINYDKTSTFYGCDSMNAVVLGDTTIHTDGGKKSIVDVTFVDDEVFLIAARSATALRKAIDTVLICVTKSFYSFGFRINFSAGETEALVRYTGKLAKAFKKNLYESGSVYNLPDAAKYYANGAQKLRLVAKYKHLGSYLSCDGTFNHDVMNRCSSAMSAFGPLACSLFGSTRLAIKLKLNFLRSLILSRLLFNVHVWSHVTLFAVCKLNAG